jgi:hypothetical protein
MKQLPPDPRFKNVDLYNTDLRKTFARVRREQEEQRKREVEQKVRPIITKRKA